MRRRAVLLLPLIAALAGCATNSSTWISAGSLTGGTLPAAGTTVSSGYVNVSVASGSAASPEATATASGLIAKPSRPATAPLKLLA